MSILGKRIRNLRDKNDFSQKKVATALGISNVQLSRYESGDRKPDPETLSLLADFYNVTTDYLLGRTDNPDETFDAMAEINHLLNKYGIKQSGFHDIDRWKAMGPEEIAELENYFIYISERAKQKAKGKDGKDG